METKPKYMIKCPSCGSVLMDPYENFNGEWEDEHTWEQEQDSNVRVLSLSFTCNNNHVLILKFLWDGQKIYNTINVYTSESIDGGIGSILGTE